jgi:hypothetical protein
VRANILARAIGQSALIGLALAIACGAVALTLAPLLDAVGFYIMPAAWLLPLVGTIMTPVQKLLVPDGGPAAGVMDILTAAILFWTVLFAVAHFGFSSWSRNSRRAT